MNITKSILAVTDRTELVVEKTSDAVVGSVKTSGRGMRVGYTRTKAAWKNHRNALGDRQVVRINQREEKRAVKSEQNDAVAE